MTDKQIAESALEQAAVSELNTTFQRVAQTYGYRVVGKIVQTKAIVIDENGSQMEELRQVGGLAVVQIPGWVMPAHPMPPANELSNGEIETSSTHL